MLDFGEKVLVYTNGLDEDAFVADTLVYDATLRNIQLIGEAATHVPVKVREAHDDIPWRAIMASETAWHTVTYTLAIVLFGRLSRTQSQICSPNCAAYWKPPAAMMLAPSQDTILDHTPTPRASNR